MKLHISKDTIERSRLTRAEFIQQKKEQTAAIFNVPKESIEIVLFPSEEK
jgi:hypothetical protein